MLKVHRDSTETVCVAEISSYMKNNMLNVNGSKRKYIVFSPKRNTKKTENLPIKIGSSYIYKCRKKHRSYRRIYKWGEDTDLSSAYFSIRLWKCVIIRRTGFCNKLPTACSELCIVRLATECSLRVIDTDICYNEASEMQLHHSHSFYCISSNGDSLK